MIVNDLKRSSVTETLPVKTTESRAERALLVQAVFIKICLLLCDRLFSSSSGLKTLLHESIFPATGNAMMTGALRDKLHKTCHTPQHISQRCENSIEA